MTHVEQDLATLLVHARIVNAGQEERAGHGQVERVVGRLPDDDGVVGVLRVVGKIELLRLLQLLLAGRRDEVQALAQDCLS